MAKNPLQTSEPGLVRRQIVVPAVATDLIPRDRLEGQIAAQVATHPLTIVSATAGSGKTTAVVRALADSGMTLAWLTLDATDTAPGRFVTYLQASLAAAALGRVETIGPLLSQGHSHADAIALILQELDGFELTLVVDEIDRIQASKPSWELLEALVGEAPAELRLVLVSRRPIELSTRPPSPERTAWIGEQELAFDLDEVEAVLRRNGNREITSQEVFESTAGWVTGVLFDAWRSEDSTRRLGGATDPLHGYLATQIIETLPAADRRFLIETSVLDEVDHTRSRALGLTDPGRRLASLRRYHLPAIWAPDGSSFRCHSRFREFLGSRLEELPREEGQRLHLASGRMLVQEEFWEEAVEAFLRADSLEEAATAAEHSLSKVLERGDLRLAERWLASFRSLGRLSPALFEAELTLAAGREEFARIVAAGDRLAEEGDLEALIANSGRAAALLSWALAHAGSPDRIPSILALAPQGPETKAVRYMLHLIDPEPDTDPPVARLSGGPLDALVIRDHYILGRLDRVLIETRSGWVGAMSTPWRIAALRASGQVSHADELLTSELQSGTASTGLIAVVGPEVRLDAGEVDEAWTMAQEGFPLTASRGTELFACLNRCVAAKIALRGMRDPELSLNLVGELATHPVAHYRYVEEIVRTWRGFALLLLDRTAEARVDVEAAVESMVEGDRILELPTAAVLLAEARWREGDEAGADAAADLAVSAAGRQRSNHLLLQALVDFPAVLARRLDAVPGPDSPWHVLGRALRQEGTSDSTRSIADAQLRLADFGRPTLTIGDEPVRTRLTKAIELLAFLKHLDPPHEATRSQLTDALFDGRVDSSARSYLRQALHWLNRSLPSGLLQAEPGGDVRLTGPTAINSDFERALRLLSASTRQAGAAGLPALRTAISLVEKGEYLAGLESTWILKRRQEMEGRIQEAQHIAAESAYREGRLGDARNLGASILRRNPYREEMWRLMMRVAGDLGDEAEVIATYQRCHEALAEIGIEVAPATTDLLGSLRR